MSAAGNTLTVTNIGEANLGTYGVLYDDSGGKALLTSSITLDSLVPPGGLPSAGRWAQGIVALFLLIAGYTAIASNARKDKNKHNS